MMIRKKIFIITAIVISLASTSALADPLSASSMAGEEWTKAIGNTAESMKKTFDDEKQVILSISEQYRLKIENAKNKAGAGLDSAYSSLTSLFNEHTKSTLDLLDTNYKQRITQIDDAKNSLLAKSLEQAKKWQAAMVDSKTRIEKAKQLVTEDLDRNVAMLEHVFNKDTLSQMGITMDVNQDLVKSFESRTKAVSADYKALNQMLVNANKISASF